MRDKSRRGGLRILIADDDSIVRELLARAMAQQGLEVEEAVDGLDALERLPGFAPDVVVTDLDMPRCSGLELCRQLKANPSTRHIRVLVITGSPFDDAELQALGCERVITKPFAGHTVVDAVVGLSQRAARAR